jgi:long-chain acyl-CoA synthetase
MNRIWLKSYPAGVPAEIDADTYTSLVDLFDRSVRQFGTRTAYVCMDKGISYAELDRRARDFAAYLQTLGLKKGDRVALMMPNVLQYPVCLFGALRAGCIVVNCNPLNTARELAHQLNDSGATLIVILENFAHVLQEAMGYTGGGQQNVRHEIRHVVTTQLGDMLGLFKGQLVNLVVKQVKKMVPPWTLPGAQSFSKAQRIGAHANFSPVSLTCYDIAFLQYTGGTTGLSKGAMLTHRNIVANLLQGKAWLVPFLQEGEQVVITALPLYHIFALTANCLVFMALGATNVLIPNPRDIPALVKTLGCYPFSVFTGVNTLFNAMLNNAEFAHLDFSHLRVSLGGGMAVQKAVAERWKAVTGVTLVEAYGLTETSPAVTINPLDLKEFNGAIGLPVPSTEIAIRDDDGRDMPLGAAGELCVRGPQVMAGYWQSPDETAKVMTHDGFLRTGDVAVMDEKGFIRIVDRKKDMILVSGFNVYPNEVEAVIAMHHGVLETAVVGVKDDKTGEAVKAFIVRRDPALSVADVVAHCHENLTGYKVPHQIEFRDELPKTNVGKILRRVLKERA